LSRWQNLEQLGAFRAAARIWSRWDNLEQVAESIVDGRIWSRKADGRK
jgi:hypothetical protein